LGEPDEMLNRGIPPAQQNSVEPAILQERREQSAIDGPRLHGHNLASGRESEGYVRTKHGLRIGLLVLLGTVTAAGSGCASMNNTDRGAVAGGAVGTAAGAAIGAASHHPLLGAVVGGLGGTATGALIGNSEDKEEQRRKDAANAAAVAQAQAQAQAQQQRIGIADVIALTRSGQRDEIIINQIRVTRSTFQLTTTDLQMLKDNGVSDRVIAEMQAARALPPGVVVPGGPPPVVYDANGVVVQPSPVVVVRPAPYYYYGGVYYRR
jgi:outer membrane lipoprotein SlyB